MTENKEFEVKRESKEFRGMLSKFNSKLEMLDKYLFVLYVFVFLVVLYLCMKF